MPRIHLSLASCRTKYFRRSFEDSNLDHNAIHVLSLGSGRHQSVTNILTRYLHRNIPCLTNAVDLRFRNLFDPQQFARESQVSRIKERIRYLVYSASQPQLNLKLQPSWYQVLCRENSSEDSNLLRVCAYQTPKCSLYIHHRQALW